MPLSVSSIMVCAASGPFDETDAMRYTGTGNVGLTEKERQAKRCRKK